MKCHANLLCCISLALPSSNALSKPTFMPSLRPSNLPNVESISTVETSCSCLPLPPPLLPPMPSLPTTGASLGCDCMPVHPKKTDFFTALALACASAPPAADCWRWLSSTTTFWAIVFEFKRSATRDDGRLRRQLFKLGRRTTSACADDAAGDLRVFDAIALEFEAVSASLGYIIEGNAGERALSQGEDAPCSGRGSGLFKFDLTKFTSRTGKAETGQRYLSPQLATNQVRHVT